jgi:hypothetical protein
VSCEKAEFVGYFAFYLFCVERPKSRTDLDTFEMGIPFM